METTFIYILEDPRNNQIRYVGKSNRPIARVSEHIGDKKKTHKAAWLKQLKNLQLKPLLQIVDEVRQTEWQFWEKHYISLYKSWGFKLTNTTDGGEGFSDPTGEIRKKISQKHLGRKQSDATKQKREESRKKFVEESGFWISNKTKEKISNTLKGYEKSESSKEKQSKTRKQKFKERKITTSGGAGVRRLGSQNPVAKGVIQYDLQGQRIKEWESAKQAGESFNATNSTIIACCKGKALTAYSFIWLYKEPKENDPKCALSVILKIKERKEFVKQNMKTQQSKRWSDI